LKALLFRIIHMGCPESDSSFDTLRARTLNTGILVAAGIATMSGLLDLAFGRYLRLIGPTVFLVFAALILALQHARHRRLAVSLTSLGFMAIIAGQFIVLGEGFGVHLWLLALILFPLLSMPRKGTGLALLLGLCHIVGLGTLGVKDQAAHGYSNDYLVSLVLAATLLLGLGTAARLFLDRLEDQVAESRDREERARRMMVELSNENPNPTLRIDRTNTITFANTSAVDMLEKLGVKPGGTFPVDLTAHAEQPDRVHEVDLIIDQLKYRVRISGLAEYGFWNAYCTDTTQVHELLDHQVEMESVLALERDLSRLKEQFLASLSHELRTPLNAIMGLSEALNEQVYGPLTDKQSESLLTIWRSGDSLLGLINDMLDFSRIGAGKYPTVISRTDLRSSANAAVYGCRVLAEEGEVELQLDLPEEPVVATVDARHLIRILKILLSNGIKFNHRGGKVGLRITPSDAGESVAVEVWDTGIGIRPEKLESLFDPFTQVDGGLSRQYEGAGLGLALSARLCRLMSATISVESTPGEGTNFTLQIPMSTPKWIEVFSDLSCPFCYILDGWLEEANMSHLVRWRGVEYMPGLSPEDGASDQIQKLYHKVLSRLKTLYPDRALHLPMPVPNTRRALASLVRVEAREPERHSEARLLLYRAIWRDGKDLSDWPMIRAELPGFDLEGLDNQSPEMDSVVEATAEWRSRGEGRLPAAFAIHSKQSWHGLGQRGDLIAFVEAELGVKATTKG
jgi:signal transduction histidine kinase